MTAKQGLKTSRKTRPAIIAFGCGAFTTLLLLQTVSAYLFAMSTTPTGRPTSSTQSTQYKEFYSSIRWMKSQIKYSSVMMEPREVDLVLKYLKGVKTYLEWGSGGSTLNYGKFPTQRVVSIEHHREWCDKMPGLLCKAKLNDKVEYHCVPVNHQNSEGRYYQYRAYVNEIERLKQPTWDFVLVDGRARVSCAIKLLSFLHTKSIVVVHDFERVMYSGEDDYSLILKYYDVIERVGETVKHGQGKRGLGVLRRKPEFDKLQGNTHRVQMILNTLSSRREI